MPSATAGDPVTSFSTSSVRAAASPYYRGWAPDLENMKPVSGEILIDTVFGNADRGTGKCAGNWKDNLFFDICREFGRDYIDYAISTVLEGGKPSNPHMWHNIWTLTYGLWSLDVDVTTDFLLCDADTV